MYFQAESDIERTDKESKTSSIERIFIDQLFIQQQEFKKQQKQIIKRTFSDDQKENRHEQMKKQIKNYKEKASKIQFKKDNFIKIQGQLTFKVNTGEIPVETKYYQTITQSIQMEYQLPLQSMIGEKSLIADLASQEIILINEHKKIQQEKINQKYYQNILPIDLYCLSYCVTNAIKYPPLFDFFEKMPDDVISILSRVLELDQETMKQLIQRDKQIRNTFYEVNNNKIYQKKVHQFRLYDEFFCVICLKFQCQIHKLQKLENKSQKESLEQQQQQLSEDKNKNKNEINYLSDLIVCNNNNQCYISEIKIIDEENQQNLIFNSNENNGYQIMQNNENLQQKKLNEEEILVYLNKYQTFLEFLFIQQNITKPCSYAFLLNYELECNQLSFIINRFILLQQQKQETDINTKLKNEQKIENNLNIIEEQEKIVSSIKFENKEKIESEAQRSEENKRNTRQSFSFKNTNNQMNNSNNKKEKDFLGLEYTPCSGHEICSKQNNCKCLLRGFCEKYCYCQKTCKKRFKGCNCFIKTYDGTCQHSICPCIKNQRDCDPDLCNCFSYRNSGTLKLLNYKYVKKCNNTELYYKIFPRVLLGKSGICRGLGVFAGEYIKKDQIIRQYTGERIFNDIYKDSIEYSLLREGVVDKLGQFYQFLGTNEYLIDALICGNKSRFVNHVVGAFINVESYIKFVNGQEIVFMKAREDISPGVELLIDYQIYENKEKPMLSLQWRESFENKLIQLYEQFKKLPSKNKFKNQSNLQKKSSKIYIKTENKTQEYYEDYILIKNKTQEQSVDCMIIKNKIEDQTQDCVIMLSSNEEEEKKAEHDKNQSFEQQDNEIQIEEKDFEIYIENEDLNSNELQNFINERLNEDKIDESFL